MKSIVTFHDDIATVSVVIAMQTNFAYNHNLGWLSRNMELTFPIPTRNAYKWSHRRKSQRKVPGCGLCTYV